MSKLTDLGSKGHGLDSRDGLMLADWVQEGVRPNLY